MIDIYHSGNDKYILKIFRRNQETENFFSLILEKLELKYKDESYCSNELSKEAIVTLLKEAIPIVEELVESSIQLKT